ncbi:hypothetical protein H072_6754 [Dactylellina haptotyla CBS 200.50]|uniref:FHA domain-containing protein n=1 Tax=Dactylellina haptotyla (strain CBS 200.50) TaxID=1284197 RepID=S8AEA4_DACHA|nr:hypothetical protein H072_6754 [Dactylellina haptotyla CBS 200.50]
MASAALESELHPRAPRLTSDPPRPHNLPSKPRFPSASPHLCSVSSCIRQPEFSEIREGAKFQMSQTGRAEVILTPAGDVADSVGSRTIHITTSHPLITVGRSSRNKNKNLLPDFDNAYFDSPVMSRSHAWIKCNDEGKVVIGDAGSMHGTFLDDKLLEPKRFVTLETGSTVKFGNSVTRGSETFPPKAFNVKVIHNHGMAEIQHGYGITSDELVLPDSPYSSEDEEDDDDDVMITEVKTIHRPDSQPNYWNDSSAWREERSSNWTPEPPSEAPITIVRETIPDPSDTPTVTNIVDLTAEAQTSQQSRTSIPRMSINEIIQRQSRQPSKTPIREGAASHPVMLDSDIEDEDLDGEYDEDDTESSHDCSSESVPTSPISAEASDISKKSIPLPDIQSPSTASGSGLERVPALDDLVSPEIKQAWASTWKAPLLSQFGYTANNPPSNSDSKPLDVTSPLTISRDSITNLANRTKVAMEQVRKAEAMRDRAQEFLRSRIEMQGSRNFYTPPKEKQTSGETYPTPVSTSQKPTKSDPVIPFWVRNFGTNVESQPESDFENAPNQQAAGSPCEGRGEQEQFAPPSPAETRSPSPELKMAGNFMMSEDEDEVEENEEIEESMEEEDLDCDMSSEADSCDHHHSELSSDEDEDMEQSFFIEISSVEGDPIDDDSEASSDDGEEEDGEARASPSLENVVEDLIVQNTVKNAMSMENFFSPNDDSEKSFETDPKEARWGSAIAKGLFEVLNSDEPEQPFDIDIDLENAQDESYLQPPANKKRKRSDSEEAEECSVAAELDDFLPIRKIAPLPRRHVPAMAHQLAVPMPIPSVAAEQEPKEILPPPEELVQEQDPRSETTEPEAKRPRVQNNGTSWGSTLATAIAGALVGGIGVFAALVATAGDI